ncbi:MAG TPA: pectin acetylesterase-family hydrolase [Polyangiaceae bacterium]|nr:pectin acetylesterase-family hydrolase [Polyangiaceae bacterium]
MRLSLRLSTLLGLLLLNACGSDDSEEGSGSSYLTPAALRELAQLGVDEYRGKARVTDEVTQGAAKRVSFDPASGPICLRGAPYAVFYVDRGSDKTMVLLDGGGACWTGFCAASEEADATLSATGPATQDPANYFADWNVVFAPYCDGSVFVGDNELTVDSVKRYHRGRRNLAAAFDVAEQHFGDSSQVLLGGFSAGGYGTLPGMIIARLTFPEADLFVMDDSGPGVQNPQQGDQIQQRLTDWKYDEIIPPSCTGCEAGHGQLSQMFSWMIKNDSNVRVSLLSYYQDQVIGVVFNGFEPAEYEQVLKAETGKVHDAYADRFKRYMLPGAEHVLSDEWLTMTADGVKLSDWVAAMVQGDDSVWKDLLASGP